MAKTRDKGFKGFFNDRDPDDVRRQFIEEPLAASQQPALEIGMRLMQFLAAVPDAVVASRRREIEHLRASGRDDDPRIAMLETSIEYAGRARTAAHLARTRVGRVAGAMMGGDAVLFHGFVSDESMTPLPDMTVRLVRAGDEGDKRSLTATTDDDGYFIVPRSAKKGGGAVKPRKSGEGGGVELTDAAEDRTVNVEIADASGTIVHRDPMPVDLGSTAYREYRIREVGSR